MQKGDGRNFNLFKMLVKISKSRSAAPGAPVAGGGFSTRSFCGALGKLWPGDFYIAVERKRGALWPL